MAKHMGHIANSFLGGQGLGLRRAHMPVLVGSSCRPCVGCGSSLCSSRHASEWRRKDNLLKRQRGRE